MEGRIAGEWRRWKWTFGRFHLLVFTTVRIGIGIEFEREIGPLWDIALTLPGLLVVFGID